MSESRVSISLSSGPESYSDLLSDSVDTDEVCDVVGSSKPFFLLVQRRPAQRNCPQSPCHQS